MNELGEDAAMPLEVSVFEPKTPFLYAGLMHMPGTDGSMNNKGREGNGADRIEVTHEVVVDEIKKGLHEITGRPMSALLNHCIVRKAAPESRQMLVEFYATVRKRKAAGRRVRVQAKKEAIAPTGMVRVQEESFGIADAPGNGAGPAPETSAPATEAAPVVKNKGGRPKGSTNKKKRGKRAKSPAKKAAPETVGAV